MRISSVVASSKNGVIGIDNKIPWHLPADLKFFKTLTLNHHVLMGRKCFDSIGKPLINRRNIVITRNPEFRAPGCEIVYSVNDGIELAKEHGEEELFIIGGAEIYRVTFDICDKLYLTIVDIELEGDTFLPEIDWTQWALIESVSFDPDDKNKYSYSFNTFQRRK
ncbi:MAG TPA: dihydrofolate reductase [Saprospiraceae bacterium]|nr:dihydrofolate reductase [Saprospiraceae bacterium]